jgi:hypothetical protein
MREDMYKVIVERPRRGGGVQGDGRNWRNSRDRGSHLGMKRGYVYGKSLNENLAPLKRWLHKQAHRPWDAVYSELSQGIDRRNTVQAHIYQHLDQFVERHARMVDGVVMVRKGWGLGGAWAPVREQPWIELFVHPVTGILLPNRGLREARQRLRASWGQRRGTQPYAEYHVIDDTTQWHRDGDCWFEITLAVLPAEGLRHDALRRCMVGIQHADQSPAPGVPGNLAMYGKRNVHAAAKRQLSRREVQARSRA